ncbi:MAG: hypothetical protein LLF98_13810 [Clostridium sp.]|uniref:hypothetical protein n=1 Tax=Clostridium sp. TaxID=1506 RepID=UPI0025C1916B|nr:hypothetical protein [Clostridium sp.]MCE5222281.1 hypothetical protein [Clostridium sp.]
MIEKVMNVAITPCYGNVNKESRHGKLIFLSDVSMATYSIYLYIQLIQDIQATQYMFNLFF